MRILIPFPPILQALEYMAVETSKVVQNIIRMNRPHSKVLVVLSVLQRTL